MSMRNSGVILPFVETQKLEQCFVNCIYAVWKPHFNRFLRKKKYLTKAFSE